MCLPTPTIWAPAIVVVCLSAAASGQSTASWIDAYRSDASRLIELATRDDFASVFDTMAHKGRSRTVARFKREGS